MHGDWSWCGFAIALLSCASCVLSSCADDGMITNPDAIVFPDSNVSYRDHVNPWLTLRCGPCHGGSSPAGDINLTRYSSLLFDRPNLVVPGAPGESLLCQVLEGTIGHPVGQFQSLRPEQVAGIRTWVREGARNN